LAWVLAQKTWIVPIPGTTKLHRLTENNGAVAITFTASELAELTAASEEVKVMGTRYTEAMEKSTGL
jgi:aryl-alcohol dehydrogenase-like predicted oxidoreductase